MSSDGDSEGSIYWGSESEGYTPAKREEPETRSTLTSGSRQRTSQPRPRLTSPRLFPREGPYTLPAPSYISSFNLSTSPGAEARNTRRLADEHNQRLLRASVDVLRATESANRALQTAQEAFQLPPIVDLTRTHSRSPDARRNQPQEMQSQSQPQSVFHTYDPADYSFPYVSRDPDLPPPPRAPPFPARPADTTHASLAGVEEVRRRRGTQAYLYRRHDGTIANMSSAPAPVYPELRPPTAQQTRMQDERAVQRQHEAHMLWNFHRRRPPQPHQSPPPPPPPQRQPILPPTPSRPSTSTSQIDSVDLTNLPDDPGSINLALAQHRRKTSTNNQKGTPLSSYKCPICMESPTEATTTICGHLFCHRCIIETLKWSEEQRQDEPGRHKPKGVCPVCRTPMDRNDNAGVRRTLVPLELLLMVGRKRQGKEAVRDSEGKENMTVQEGKKRKQRETTEELFGNFTTI